MTSIQRTMHRASAGPLVAALAVAAAFGTGVVVGGPVLHLATAPAVVRSSLSASAIQSGRDWELQRIQQTRRRMRIEAVTNPGTLAGARAWERERRQELGGR